MNYIQGRDTEEMIMNRKAIAHALLITAIIFTVFFAAALSGAKTASAAPEQITTMNLAKADLQIRQAHADL